MYRIAYKLARICELSSGALWDASGKLAVWAMRRDPKWQENYIKRHDRAMVEKK